MQMLVMIAWARTIDLLHCMNLSSLDLVIDYCSCPATCCRLVVPLLMDPAFLNQWHKIRQAHSPYDEQAGVFATSKMVRTRYDRRSWLMEPDVIDEERHVRSSVPIRPDGMKIKVTGLVGMTEFRLVHALGFGCAQCPIQNGMFDTARCEWEASGGPCNVDSNRNVELF